MTKEFKKFCVGDAVKIIKKNYCCKSNIGEITDIFFDPKSNSYYYAVTVNTNLQFFKAEELSYLT